MSECTNTLNKASGRTGVQLNVHFGISMKSFWFQIIDAEGAQHSDGTFVPINWREMVTGNVMPETWKRDKFPSKMFVDICQAKSGDSAIFNNRFSWIKE